MSQEDRELALEAYIASTARPEPDFETVNRLFDPEHVFVPLTARVDTRRLRGATVLNEFTDLRNREGSIEAAVDVGHGKVLLVSQGEYRPSPRGPTVPLRSWIVATIRGGKVFHTEIYADPDEAPQAARASA